MICIILVDVDEEFIVQTLDTGEFSLLCQGLVEGSCSIEFKNLHCESVSCDGS